MNICGRCLQARDPESPPTIIALVDLGQSRGSVLDGQIVDMRLVQVNMAFEVRVPNLFPGAECITCGGKSDGSGS